nr:TetR/AcrR family transcriptional regulator [Pseudonocardia sp. KRD291]
MTTSTPSGRPRDPDLEQRVARAALAVFGEAGWRGFTVDAVARRAGVGKASIYLRWTDKQGVLIAALESYLGRVADVDTGTLHGDLVALACQMLELYLGDAGRAAMRLGHEARAIPELAPYFDTLTRSQTGAARAMVRRGIARGDVDADTSVTLLLDCLVGGAMNHVVTTPPEFEAQLAVNVERYARELVDFLFRAVAASQR